MIFFIFLLGILALIKAEDDFVMDYLEETNIYGRIMVTNQKNQSLMIYTEMRMVIFIVFPALSEYRTYTIGLLGYVTLNTPLFFAYLF